MRLDNRIFVRLQPWKEDALVSKLEGGIGDRLQTFYLQSPTEVLYRSATHKWNSVYVYAGAEGRLSKYLSWDATGKSKKMDFFANGTYEFQFTTMSISEKGTWTYADGRLSVTTEAGKEYVAELIQ